MENLNVRDLLRIIRSGNNLIYVVTDKERSTEAVIVEAAADIKGAGSPFVWTCTEGVIREGNPCKETVEPLAAINFAMSQPGPAIFLFKDLSAFWGTNPFIIRKLKEFAAHSQSNTLIILGAEEAVPEQLQEDLVILYQGLPRIGEIREHLAVLRDHIPSLAQACAENPELEERLAVASQGLYLSDIERSNDTDKDQLGGMENLKLWLERREKVFGLDNISSGAMMPKGVLVMGISGCGKSLFVKVIAAQWRLPLIRLDMAILYGGSFGTPESSLRKAFRIAEAIAPCVLWIDEIEAGISSQGFKAEGGSASRVLGSFLTWMQEKKSPVFVAATANAIEMLPAEVLRKGRFDEIFYVGLPDEKAREEIYRIHMKKQNIDISGIDLSLMVSSPKRLSGAEIEQVVKSAVFEALAEKRPVVEQDFLVAFSRTVPLSVTMAEQIKSIEAWAYQRAVPASGKYH
ncbi:MAG: AAA family ATPase [Nitrospirae bacterium]|nr:AAA family ATPase [Nitrospirota bacterium]